MYSMKLLTRMLFSCHLYKDALLVYKIISYQGFVPDIYTYSLVLKASSRSDNIWVGLQVHGAVLKVGLYSRTMLRESFILLGFIPELCHGDTLFPNC